MRITLRQLAHARSLLRRGSFRDAAAEMNLTQPALTRSIQALESSLGVMLFDRLPTGVEATRAGESLLRQADEILLRSRELEREAQLIAGFSSGNVKVSMGAYPAHELVPSAIAACLEKVEGFSSQIIVGDWKDAVHTVIAREADVAVADVTTFAHDERLSVTELEPEAIYFVCRSGHPLAGREDLALKDLCDYPMAGCLVPPHLAVFFRGFLRAGSIDPETGDFHPAIEVKSVEAAVRVAMSSNAIAAAQLTSVEQQLKGGNLSILRLPGNPLHLRVGLVHLQERVLSPMARLFLDTLIEARKSISARDIELRARYLPG